MGILWRLTEPQGAPCMPQAAAISTVPSTSGVLVSGTEGMIELGLPGSEYRLRLAVARPIEAAAGARIKGVIRARAKRVDVTRTGGRFVEPIFGRPRRLQGRIIGGDAEANEIVVAAGGPIFVCALTDGRQKAEDFAVGQMVGFDVEAGAKFEEI